MPISSPAGDLVVVGLRKRMPGFTLEADFRVRVGERALLAAPSGFGKTTLLRLLSGLETPDAGSIFLGEREITSLPPQQRAVGFVFQDQALFPDQTVLENAAFGLKVRGISKPERESRAREILERVGLGDRVRSAVTELSGGEAQRVAWVRAWVWKPQLMLLDEPYSGLDRGTRLTMIEELLKLHREWPVPLIGVSHEDDSSSKWANARLEARVSGELRRIRTQSP